MGVEEWVKCRRLEHTARLDVRDFIAKDDAFMGLVYGEKLFAQVWGILGLNEDPLKVKYGGGIEGISLSTIHQNS